MLGKAAMASITIVIIIIFSGVAFTTIFESNTSLNTSAGYLNATSTNNKPLYLIGSPGEIEFNVTVRTSATTVYFFSIGNITVKSAGNTDQIMNLTTFKNTSAVYNGKQCNSTNNYNYVTINSYQNGSIVHLFLNIPENVFNNMTYFNQENPKQSTYIESILIIGSNDGASFLGFAIGKV